jgi:hypothetical protein
VQRWHLHFAANAIIHHAPCSKQHADGSCTTYMFEGTSKPQHGKAYANVY